MQQREVPLASRTIQKLQNGVSYYLKKGVSEPVLQHAFEYWRNIDKETGDRIAKGVNGG